MQRILLAGRDQALRDKAHMRLKDACDCTVEEASEVEELRALLGSHSFDAALLAYDEAFPASLSALAALAPSLRYIAYQDHQDITSLRQALRLGADDLISLSQDDDTALQAALRPALDGGQAQHAAPALRQEDDPGAAFHRGLLLQNRLTSGRGSLFFLNANRSEFLLVQVVPLASGSAFNAQVIEAQWLHLLGAHNAMIFPLEGHLPRLMLGASIEMSYADRRSALRALHEHLERFFASLDAQGCVGVATSCGADLLSASVFSRMSSLCALVFYAQQSRYYPYNFSVGASVFPEAAYHAFSAHLTADQLEAALACIDQAADKLTADLPAPDSARERLLHFLWLYGTLRQKNLMSVVAFELESNHITHLKQSLCDIIVRQEEASHAQVTKQTPLQQLISGIQHNPGAELSVDEAAAKIGFSRSHFCRVFKQQTGQSFAAFVIDQRMHLAARLLTDSQLSVPDISRMVGMDKVWYFRKVFLRHHGVTAEAWRAGKLSGQGAHPPLDAAPAEP